MNRHPSAPQNDAVADAWRRHRAYLVNLAYQMLGDVGDAEDIAQEAFLRLSRADPLALDDIRGWLTVVTGRLCLDHVRSARARHERPGDVEQQQAPLHQSRLSDPADRVTLDDEVSAAMLEVLRRLSPGERVAFVLHDVFGVPFDAIAETVGRPAGTCRQLARRARQKFSDTRATTSEVAIGEHQVVTDTFITACSNGDFTALAAVLDPTVWGVATLLVEPAAPPQVNRGPRDVAINLLQYLGPGVVLVTGPVGQPALLAYANRRLFAVITLTIRRGLVTRIEAIADPSARSADFPPQP